MKEIIAAFMFFTRLPLGHICQIPAGSFKRIVAYWPLTGLITGGLMTAVYLLAIHLHLHILIAVILAFASRLLLTGALHEDGLADFFDGFGGGRTREQVLIIMKDSHSGSYGVLGLILYILMWISSVFILVQFFKGYEFILFFTCDIWSKWCASQIINVLPYARKEEESKIRTTYERMSRGRFVIGFVCGIIPFLVLPAFKNFGNNAQLSILGFPFTSGFLAMIAGAVIPFVLMLLLTHYMKRRIGGYTGDCCGALFLLCELSYLLTLNSLWTFI